MHIKSINSRLIKSLFICFLFTGSLRPANACGYDGERRPESIAEKMENSQYVFEGVIIKITAPKFDPIGGYLTEYGYATVEVEQYFKGIGTKDVKIFIDDNYSSCDYESYGVGIRHVFFTKNIIGGLLSPVFDHPFGSARDIDTEIFIEAAMAKKCMATYDNDILTIPCIAHKEHEQIYKAKLQNTKSLDNLTLALVSAHKKSNIHIKRARATKNKGFCYSVSTPPYTPNICPSPAEKPLTIADKLKSSDYTFDGTIIEIANSHVKVKINQYFKGFGLDEVKMERYQGESEITGHYTLNKHVLFFIYGGGYLDNNFALPSVLSGYDPSTMLEMNPDNFMEVATATECMATYNKGYLSVPCIAHKNTRKVYRAGLNTIKTKDNISLSVLSVTPKTDIKQKAIVNKVAFTGQDMYTYPNEYYFTVTGIFANGCQKLGSISTTQGYKKFMVTMLLQDQSPNPACTMTPIPFEKTITIKLSGLRTGSYTINVNDSVSAPFYYLNPAL
jgi:hypothetical protein